MVQQDRIFGYAVRAGAVALLAGAAFVVEQCASDHVQAHVPKMDGLLNDLRAEQLPQMHSVRLPEAATVLKLRTDNFIFIFDPGESGRGTISIFSKESGDGVKYAVVDSTGKIEGSASLAEQGINELKAKYPQSLDGTPTAAERSAP